MRSSRLIILSVTIAMFIFLACKKKCECTCWILYKDGSVNVNTKDITATRKNAQKECNATTAKPDTAVSKDCEVKYRH